MEENNILDEVDTTETVSSNSKIMSIVGIVLLILSATFYALYLNPLRGEYADVGSALDEKEVKIEELTTRIENLKEAEVKMDLGTEVQKNVLLAAIPVGVNQDGVIEDLVKIAKDNAIDLNSVSFGKGDSEFGGVGGLRLNASFQGDYNDLLNFLKSIEQNSRLFKVDSINVQVSYLDDLDMRRVTFSLSIMAYYQQ